jgi:hypothetical protein
LIDLIGRRHSITAIIFGRHHPSFGDAVHVQVCDEGWGRLALLVAAKDAAISAARIVQGCCFDGLDFDRRVELIAAPLRTGAGDI